MALCTSMHGQYETGWWNRDSWLQADPANSTSATSSAIFEPVELKTTSKQPFRGLWPGSSEDKPERLCRALWRHQGRPEHPFRALWRHQGKPEQPFRALWRHRRGQARQPSQALWRHWAKPGRSFRALWQHWGTPERLSRAPNGSSAVSTKMLKALNGRKPENVPSAPRSAAWFFKDRLSTP